MVGEPERGMWKRPRMTTRPFAPGEGMVGELEAFLHAEFRDWYRERRCEVPPWAACNALAHGGLRQICRLANDQPGDCNPPDIRTAALSVLAREIVIMVAWDATIFWKLQRARLDMLESQSHRAGRSCAYRSWRWPAWREVACVQCGARTPTFVRCSPFA